MFTFQKAVDWGVFSGLKKKACLLLDKQEFSTLCVCYKANHLVCNLAVDVLLEIQILRGVQIFPIFILWWHEVVMQHF